MDNDVKAMVDSLNDIALALNNWYAERKAAHDVRAEAYRRKQDASWGTNNPWVYAAEAIRRDDAETLEPIRVLMRRADAALKPFEAAST